MRIRTIAIVATIIAGLAALSGILYFTRTPTLHGAVIDPPMAAWPIELVDQWGKPFSLDAQQGKVVLLYFGFTNCPDECPLTMAHLKLAVDMLGNQPDRVVVAMVTTDPSRDTASALAAFLGKFKSDFVGLLGTESQLQAVWQSYGVTVENGGETHSNYLYVIDGQGRFRETFLPDSAPADIAADVSTLLRGY